jgi:hypothetical protein
MAQTVNIPAATREEYRLVLGYARLAAVLNNDPHVITSINKVATFQEALWARADQAQQQRQDDADKQAATTPPV